jgi:hypothetical protein
MRIIRNIHTLLERFIVTYWWTWLFCLICLLLYELQARTAQKEGLKLQLKAQELNENSLRLTVEKEHLAMQIDSFSDPRYVEMCLREELGMIRSNQIKVVFK